MKRIESVFIRNIHGIERAEFPLGTFTVLQGDNGTGKSSVLQAISAVFEGGHDPKWIRAGASEGEIILTLSDGVTITATVKPDGTKREVRTSDGSIVSKPAAYIKALADGFSFDPVAFLQADKKDRAKYLLEAMPIVFTVQEIQDAVERIPAGSMNLDAFHAYRAGLTEERRVLNVDRENLEGAISTLSKTLPDGNDQDWAAEVTIQRTRLEEFRVELATVKQGINAEADAAIAKINADTVAKIQALKDACAKDIETVRRLQQEETTKATVEIQSDIEATAVALATAEAKARAQAQSVSTKAAIDEYREKAKAKFYAGERLTNAIKKLDALKARKLEDSPIPGLEVRDGEIFVNGVALDAINTQQQYFVAFQVAALAPGELGFMVCDRSESIVGKQWDDFCAAAAQSGFQVVAARSLPDEPLAANVDGKLFPVGVPAGTGDPSDGAPRRRRKSQ